MAELANVCIIWCGATMRQIICFLVAAAMFGGGLYILWDSIVVAHLALLRMAVVGASLAFIGGIWLWIDFGAPLVRRVRGFSRTS
jgi:hypothetical protein